MLQNNTSKWRVSLSNFSNKARPFMTFSTGFYFLWVGLMLLATSAIGAVLSG
jgi:hypothetical protein